MARILQLIPPKPPLIAIVWACQGRLDKITSRLNSSWRSSKGFGDPHTTIKLNYMNTRPVLDDIKVPVRYKLSAIWASVLFCYIYVDYFELYIPGKLHGMLEGNIMPLGPVTQGILLGTAIMMAIPSLLVFLSLTLSAPLSRWFNIVFGVIYTMIQLIVVSQSGWIFYIAIGLVEAALTALIVWTAWTWPRRGTT
ncbi:MAG: DUF6326 family protein [Pseudomonadota bacterium]